MTMIAPAMTSLRVLHVAGHGWLIEAYTPAAWSGNQYSPERDPLVALSGFSLFDFVHELCAVLAYRIGRDDSGWFHGFVLAPVDDDRYRYWFGEMDAPTSYPHVARRSTSEHDGYERLIPFVLLDLRIALSFAIRPIINVVCANNVVEIAPTMSEHGLYVGGDDDRIAAIMREVLPSYGVPVEWNSRAIADEIDPDKPFASFDP